MKNKTANSKCVKVLIFLTLLSLAFIWCHSMMPKEISYSESGWLLKIMKPVMAVFYKGDISDYNIRKAAHFLEYAVLGFLLACLAAGRDWKGIWKFLFVLAMSLLTASLDETIQIFSGRNSQVSDVILDVVSAVIAGVVVFAIDGLNCFAHKLKRRN